MSGYVIVEFKIYDKKELEKYKELAPATVKTFEGEFVVQEGKKIALEGDWNPERIVLVKFPTFERAKEWYDSEMYAKASVFRRKAAETRAVILEGL